MDIDYVHIRWPDGTEDMVPASTAHIREECGDFTIVDATPARWRTFKPRLPLGQSARPKTTTQTATAAASQAEEATK